MKKFFSVAAAMLLFGTVYSGETYNFLMISDTHFGPESTFGSKPPAKVIKKLKRFDQAFPHYLAMFDDMAKKSDPRTGFLIVAGDMIEGWAHSQEAYAEQFLLFDRTLKKYFKIPLYMVCGNHEITGRSGRSAYRRVIAPLMAKNAGQAAGTVNYTVKHGGDLFIFIDNYTPGAYEFVEKTLKNLQERPRYVFLVIHVDLLPQAYPLAVKMCKLLVKYDAIILNGHTHRTRVLQYQRDGNTLTQFSIGSYLQPKLIRYGEIWTDKDKFLKSFRAGKHVALMQRTELFDTEVVPFITSYKDYSGQTGVPGGYARIHVSDAGITVSVQSAYLADKPFEIPLIRRK